ncbi:MAG: hypothetical protein AAGG08_01115 [Actinomycetota bacterium]
MNQITTTNATATHIANRRTVIRRLAGVATAAAVTIGAFGPAPAALADEPTIEQIEVAAIDADPRVAVMESALHVLQIVNQMERGDLEAMLATAGLPIDDLDGFVDLLDGLAEITSGGGSVQDVLDFLHRTGFDTSDLHDVTIGSGDETVTVEEVVSSLFGDQDGASDGVDTTDAEHLVGDTNPCGVDDPNAALSGPSPAEAMAWINQSNPASGLMLIDALPQFTVQQAEETGAVVMAASLAAATVLVGAGFAAAGAGAATAAGGTATAAALSEVIKAFYDTGIKGTYEYVDKAIDATGGYSPDMQGEEHIDGLDESPMMNELKQALFRDRGHVYAELSEGSDPTLTNPNPYAEDEGSLDDVQPGTDPSGLDGLTNPLEHDGATIADVPCSTFGKLEIAVGEGGVSPTESYPTPDNSPGGEIDPSDPNGPDIGS